MRKDSNLEGRMDWCEGELVAHQKHMNAQMDINVETGKAFDAVGEALETTAEELGFLRTALGVVCMIAGGLTMGLILIKKDLRELKNSMNEG